MPLASEQKVTIFLNSYEKKVKEWVKMICKIMHLQKNYTITEVIDDFVNEFRVKIGLKSYSSSLAYNVKKNLKKWGKKFPKKSKIFDGKPVWDSKKGPFCYKCGEYGYLKKDCKKNISSQNATQSIS
ncbi:hypothetical protein F5Y11DRAFT_365377 [Daldinia sp. FL1419]|nr:hypothetical protein F5Y11DRAFT_365377 [Daldinia sp. FL1419]